MSTKFDFSKKFTKKVLQDFANILIDMQDTIDFKVSSRGWCYLMEQSGYINKSQFDKVDLAINRCRKEGLIPVDFVAEEAARGFANVEEPNELDPSAKSLKQVLEWMLRDTLEGSRYYTPNWWDGEKYYIQMVVEKIDLKTIFEPVAAKYHIPIANAKGWSSILQRAEYARRFKEAEDRGLQCVLLYCGDHDPDGLRISDTMRKNLQDIADIRWDDDEVGYDPQNLIIKRFGLNYDFILANNYTWIDNLYTGSGGELAKVENGKIIQGTTKDGNPHKNFKLPYLQEYVKTIGVRKCEANAIVTTPDKARAMVTDEIVKWLGPGAMARFEVKRQKVKDDYAALLEETQLKLPIMRVLNGDDFDDDSNDE